MVGPGLNGQEKCAGLREAVGEARAQKAVVRAQAEQAQSQCRRCELFVEI